MPRPSKWNSPTEAIRVPAHAVEAVLALARQLDQEDGFVQNDDAPESSPPYLVAVGEDRYLITPPNAPADVWELADQLIDQHFSHLTPDQLFLVLGELAQRWGKPVNR